MRSEEILALYDLERARPIPEETSTWEDLGTVVREIGERSTILLSRLDPRNAATVVAEQTAFFAARGASVEWKLHGHDRPPELATLLAAAGYKPDPPETLMVYELDSLPSVLPPSPDVEVQRVLDQPGLDLAVKLSHVAFGAGEGWGSDAGPHRLADATFAAFLGLDRGVPVASGRLELPRAGRFASLWGGGTAPDHRGRGVYRALVYARARLARERGYRFLTVDARESSRPILHRLGFVPLTTMQGWVLEPRTPRARDPPRG